MKPVFRWVLFISALWIIFSRNFTLFAEPRFWAEEGAFWFSYAFLQDWKTALFESLCGYYNFYPIFSTLIASRTVPLEYAPLITTLMALGIQIVLLLIIAFDDSTLWNTLLKKMAITAVILFAPKSGEIWLNTNGSQYYLSLIAALILIVDGNVSSKIRKHGYRILLMLAGLTGLLSCVLTPLFFAKVWKTRKKEDLVHFLILILCSAVQTLAVFAAPPNSDRAGYPGIPSMGLIVVARGFFESIHVPLTARFSHFVKHQLYGSEAFALVGVLALLLMAGILWLFKKRIVHPSALYLVGTFLLLSFFPAFFAIGGKENIALLDPNVGNRYFYAPSVLALMMLFSSLNLNALKAKERLFQGILLALFVFSMINGISHFYLEKLGDSTNPNWKKEVEIWRADPSYKPKIWPVGWRIKLQAG